MRSDLLQTLEGLAFVVQDHFKNTKELLYNDEATGLYVIRLRNVLYNTFCVKMNFSLLSPPALEENCTSLEPFLMRPEEAEMTDYVSSTPPLLSHTTGPPLDIKTARKPLVLQPTTIRLNKVRPPLPSPPLSHF